MRRWRACSTSFVADNVKFGTLEGSRAPRDGLARAKPALPHAIVSFVVGAADEGATVAAALRRHLNIGTPGGFRTSRDGTRRAKPDGSPRELRQDPDGASWKIPADLPPEMIARVQAQAVATFRALELSGMARVDFFVARDGGAIYVNEVNTIPGFTAISMYPKMWEASGLSPRALITRLIELAIERRDARRSLKTTP